MERRTLKPPLDQAIRSGRELKAGASNTSVRGAVLALMIGELNYMSPLNRISTIIVDRAVAIWRRTPGEVLICESAPMAAQAIKLGVAESAVVTALPQRTGHTTRLVAQWFAASPFCGGDLRLITHAIHAGRAGRTFARLGIAATVIGLDIPFDREDPDWKLRSAPLFRAYNAVALLYGVCRGWA